MCTSTGSNVFLTHEANNPKYTIQNCYVEKWRNEEGAVVTKSTKPLLIFDNTFVNPPNTNPPIYLNPLDQYTYRVDKVFSGNSYEGSTALYKNNAQFPVWEVDRPEPTDYKLNGPYSFRSLAPNTGSKVFDAVQDFGARSGGDDGPKIRSCINAAKQEGNGAVCYLPKGGYIVSTTITVDGSNYMIQGAGYITRVDWGASTAGDLLRVESPTNVVISHMWFYKNEELPGTIAIHQVRKEGVSTSSVIYDRIYGIFGSVELEEEPRDTILLDGLSTGDAVNIKHLNGMLRIKSCARAHIHVEFLDGNPLIVEGEEDNRDGLITVLSMNGMNVQVYDNQNLVMGDYYYEQSGGDWNKYPNINALLLKGNPNSAPGRVVVQGAKCMLYDSNILGNIQNYRGLFSYVLCSVETDNAAFTERKVLQSGDNPLDVLFLSILNNEPFIFYPTGSAVNFYNFPNTSAQLGEEDSLSEARPNVVLTLDAFADMGRQDLGFNSPNNAAPGSISTSKLLRY
jgi:hypothetical protein